MLNNHRILAITAGDPAGIGPEVALKALSKLGKPAFTPILIIRHKVIEQYYPHLLGDYIVVSNKDELSQNLKSAKPVIFNIEPDLPISPPGLGNADTGHESRLYIDAALDLWKAGIIDGIVTGPVHKGYIEESGYHFTGHTEYIANSIGEQNPAMLMYSEEFRVLLVTTHIPVQNIEKSINTESIYRTIKIGHSAMTAIDGPNPLMAITGLDPHCGDNGAIGKFDMEFTTAAIELARDEGINIEGPFPADTLFIADRWKRYNLVIAHYHDQGLIPFKILAFEHGVNATLGLSIVRTSVDHGTAFDIAGSGRASHMSMASAIKLALRLISIEKLR